MKLTFEDMCKCKERTVIVSASVGLRRRAAFGIPTGRKYYGGHEACGGCGGFMSTRRRRRLLHELHLTEERDRLAEVRTERKKRWGEPKKKTTAEDMEQQERVRIARVWPSGPDEQAEQA